MQRRSAVPWLCLWLTLFCGQPGQSEASLACLNADAPAQARLLAYGGGKPTVKAAPPAEELKRSDVFIGQPIPTETAAKTPYDIPMNVLVDWTRWPATKLDYGGKGYEFMGIHLNNKTQSNPCIQLNFRIFAPQVKEIAGIAVFESPYGGNRILRIPIGEAIANVSGKNPVAFDRTTEGFYVIDLRFLRNLDYWKRRFANYVANIQASKSPASAAPVYFERFAFNVIRLSRYTAPTMDKHQRETFEADTNNALRTRGVTCGTNPRQVMCILNAIILGTELGSTSPLRVTDALDNSGLAFGPRQLDLGQGRNDATKFAMKYLIDNQDPSQADWPKRFLKPIEAMSISDVRLLYDSVVVTFNDQLLGAYDGVLSLYLDGLTEMAGNAEKAVSPLALNDDLRLLAQLIAADFANKWGDAATTRVVEAVGKAHATTECALVLAWRDAVAIRYSGRSDVADFERRVGIVTRAYYNASGKAGTDCL